MLEFKPDQNYNSGKNTYNKNSNQSLMVLFRKWHAFILSPIILLINNGIIPFWITPLPILIIWSAAIIIIIGILYTIFYYKIFQINLANFKNPILSFHKIFEIFGYNILLITLWYVSWIGSFYIYSISIIFLIIFYSVLLGKQISDLQNKIH